MAITRTEVSEILTVESIVQPSHITGFDPSPNKILRSGLGSWKYAGFAENPFDLGWFRFLVAWEDNTQCEDIGLSLYYLETEAEQTAYLSIQNGTILDPAGTPHALADTTEDIAHVFYLHVNGTVITMYQGLSVLFTGDFDTIFGEEDPRTWRLGFASCVQDEYGHSGYYSYMDKLRHYDVGLST